MELVVEQTTKQVIPFEVRRLTVDDYHRLIDLGFFAPNERVELLQGFLHAMSPQNPPHPHCLTTLTELFYACLAGAATIRTQAPITLPGSNSEPEPDLIIAKKRPGGYKDRHPGAEDVLLVVEISESSLKDDREGKGAVYAMAGIADYWIVNIIDDWLEVYRDPATRSDGTGVYLTRLTVVPGQSISPITFPNCIIQVDHILRVTFEEPTDDEVE